MTNLVKERFYSANGELNYSQYVAVQRDVESWTTRALSKRALVRTQFVAPASWGVSEVVLRAR